MRPIILEVEFAVGRQVSSRSRAGQAGFRRRKRIRARRPLPVICRRAVRRTCPPDLPPRFGAHVCGRHHRVGGEHLPATDRREALPGRRGGQGAHRRRGQLRPAALAIGGEFRPAPAVAGDPRRVALPPGWRGLLRADGGGAAALALRPRLPRRDGDAVGGHPADDGDVSPQLPGRIARQTLRPVLRAAHPGRPALRLGRRPVPRLAAGTLPGAAADLRRRLCGGRLVCAAHPLRPAGGQWRRASPT